MSSNNNHALVVRRLGQQGVSSRTLPGWHTLGFGHGRGETIAYVKNDLYADLYANLYAAAPDLLAALKDARVLASHFAQGGGPVPRERFDAIDAAIARAEGRGA